MNYFKTLIFIMMLALNLTSCSYDVLEKEPLDIISEKEAWSDMELIDAQVTKLYDLTDFNTIFDEVSKLINCTDESRTCFGWCDLLNVFTLGIITPDNMWPQNTNVSEDSYYPAGWPYTEIRAYNEFLQKIETATVDNEFKEQRKAEVRFLRAFTYFNLAMRFGGVPLLTEPQSFNADLMVPRNTEHEIYEFVRTELDDIINVLPGVYPDSEYGRISKYTALALKSRAMLYAASIATYGEMKLDGLLGVPKSEANKYYQESYDASNEIIESKLFSLYNKYDDKAKNYQMLFLDEGNEEIILAEQFTGVERGHRFDQCAQPIGFKFGVASSVNPYLEMVDSYEFVDGTPGNAINYNQEIETKELYKDKEPRFHATILFNQSFWIDDTITTHYFSVDNDVNGKIYNDVNSIGHQVSTREAGATQTGFIIKKYLQEKRDIAAWESNQDFIVFRLGEMYLNLAEAAYQLGQDNVALEAVNKIRARGGVALRQSIDMDKIKHERKIELAFEGIRFWDLRRWRDATESLTGVFHKLVAYYIRSRHTFGYLIQNAQGNKVRSFREEHYYMPIYRDRLREDPNLVQNPGYN